MEDTKALINSLRKSFLIHSYLYYHKSPIISDNLFDARAKHLARLHRDHPEIAEHCIYQDYFKDYNPATGMDVPDNEWIREEAMKRLEEYKR